MRSYVQGFLLYVLFLIVSAVPMMAAEPQHDDALLQRLVVAHGNHATAQGSLKWLTRNIADLAATPRIQNVQFYLAFPERYHVIITKPGDIDWKHRFVSDGTSRWIVEQFLADEQPSIKKTVVGDDNGIEQQLMACFRFDLVSLRKDFSLIAYTKIDATHEVVLTPKSPNLIEQLTTLTMVFNKDLTLQRIISDDPKGNRFEFQVDEVNCDKPIDPALFSVAQ